MIPLALARAHFESLTSTEAILMQIGAYAYLVDVEICLVDRGAEQVDSTSS